MLRLVAVSEFCKGIAVGSGLLVLILMDASLLVVVRTRPSAYGRLRVVAASKPCRDTLVGYEQLPLVQMLLSLPVLVKIRLSVYGIARRGSVSKFYKIIPV